MINSSNKTNASKLTNKRETSILPMLGVTFQRELLGSLAWPAQSIPIHKPHGKPSTYDLVWEWWNVGKKKIYIYIYIYIHIVTNATQRYNVRLWKPNVHISVIGLYLAGKPDDGINLAGHSLPYIGLGWIKPFWLI